MSLSDPSPEVQGTDDADTAPTGRPVLTAGSDGSLVRTIATDTSGRTTIVGAGTAGTPTGGVMSVQGVSGGQAVPVSITGGGGGGTAQADRSTFTDGTTQMTPIGGVYNETGTAPTEDQAAAVRITSARGFHTTIRDSTGDSAMDDTNNAVRVNVVAGSSSAPSKVDDSAFTPAVDSVSPIGAFYDDVSPDTVNEGDVGITRMTQYRALHVNLRSANGAEYGTVSNPIQTAPAASIPSTLSNLVINRLKNGSSSAMIVNGSVTPVVFSYLADSTNDIRLLELKIFLADNGTPFGDNKFGAIAALTNGCLIEVISNSSTLQLGNLQVNDDFALLSPGISFNTDQVGANDWVTAVVSFGGLVVLKAGTGDLVRITIRDNLTTINYFQAVASGVKV